MSVVAVKKYKDRIEVAADSVIFRGESLIDSNCTKLFINDKTDLIVGSTGEAEELTLIDFFLSTEKVIAPDPNVNSVVKFMISFLEWKKETFGQDSKIENSYVFVIDSGVFITEDFHVIEIKEGEFYSIGGGQDVATAALHLNKTPKEACELACNITPLCTLPVISVVRWREIA